MFWRFGFNSSTLDTLLDKEDVTLEEVLEEEDLIQEAKSMNPKLIDFLNKPEHIKALLNYIIATDLEETKKFKYPFLASEIIACEIQPIIDAIVIDHKEELLVPFWAYLDYPSQPKRKASDVAEEQQVGLDSLQASYFCKTIGVLLSKYPIEMMSFIQSEPENLNKILSHLQTSAIMDLLLTLVRMEELIEGKGIVKWLSDHGLLGNLMDRLDPYLDSEEHSIAQQCICEIVRMSQTSLPDSPSIGINELIMDLKSEPMMKRLAKYMLDPDAPNATSTLINGVSIIIDIIRHNNSDLETDPQGVYEQRTTTVSLGDMLQVMGDHVAEFTSLLLKPRSVHGSIRTTLGELEPLGFERLKICELFAELLHCSNMSNLNQEESVGDYLKSKFVETRAMPICIDLFFGFPWNNFLHYVIYDMLHQVFNGRMDIGLNRNLAIAILKDSQLTDKIVIAQKANDEACAKPKGMRAGYMGHLTFISDEIMKLFEGYPETIVLEVKDDIDMESWNNYCNNELKETKERDLLPLGGPRPDSREDEEDEDVLDNSRFLPRPDNESSFEEEDDDEDTDHWITGRDDYGNGYSMPNKDDDDEEEEYNSDEEQEEDHITPDWTRNFNKFSQPTLLRRIPSHHEDEDDQEEYQDDDFDHLADAEELERRAALRKGQYNKPDDDEDDDFGDFESADDQSHSWDMLSNNMDNLNVNNDIVRAIKTKEEEEYLKQKKDFHNEEEQEGEV